MPGDFRVTLMKYLDGKYEVKHGRAWSKATEEMYAETIMRLPRDVYEAIGDYILASTWLPMTGDILRAAAEILSPAPSAQSAFQEVSEAAGRYGLYGRTDPELPNFFLAGAPTFSHPDVGLAVEDVGGWSVFADGDGKSEARFAQFVKAYDKRLESRRAAQIAVLHDYADFPDLFPKTLNEKCSVSITALPNAEQKVIPLRHRSDTGPYVPVPDKILDNLISGMERQLALSGAAGEVEEAKT